jgi:hypothetical protein
MGKCWRSFPSRKYRSAGSCNYSLGQSRRQYSVVGEPYSCVFRRILSLSFIICIELTSV